VEETLSHERSVGDNILQCASKTRGGTTTSRADWEMVLIPGHDQTYTRLPTIPQRCCDWTRT